MRAILALRIEQRQAAQVLTVEGQDVEGVELTSSLCLPECKAFEVGDAVDAFPYGD